MTLGERQSNLEGGKRSLLTDSTLDSGHGELRTANITARGSWKSSGLSYIEVTLTRFLYIIIYSHL